ncbi:MAG: glycerophosphodiester phosphodiesterase [Streptomycetaceae bacterium]|nr:glycerophosphodiester phosphodiesterase [Streptomycetaceae bacterium]
MRRILPALGLAGALLATVVAVPAAAHDDEARSGRPTAAPLVIGHRGASGYRPEHTLESYRLAIRMGADYIEPDLVSTRDGVLVARHENFTLAELKTLRAKERLPQVRPTNTAFDGKLEIPTFQEVVDLARAEGRRVGRTIGIYPETKHPSYFQSIGLPLEEPLVQALKRNGLNGRKAKVFVQSFETANLRKLDKMTDVPLIQLLDASGRPFDFTAAGDPRTYQDLVKPENLKWIAGYADGIGTAKNLLIPRDPAGRLLPPTSVLRDAHRAGLLVHAWTFRAENQFLPADFRLGTDPNARGDYIAEYEAFYGIGLDGVFADQPDTAVAARAGLAS